MIDEYQLKDTAHGLRLLFHALSIRKYEKIQAPRGERMMKPSPGPRSPGDDWAISAEDCLLEERTDDRIPGGLRNMAADAATYIGSHPRPPQGQDRRPPQGQDRRPNGEDICAWIAFNSQAIAERFPAAEDLLDLLDSQARWINNKIQPPNAGELAARPERRQTSTSICARLAQMGIKIDAARLRKLVQRGHITSEQRPDGRNTYLLTEVMNYLTETKTAESQTGIIRRR